MRESSYFLPYQVAYLQDTSRLKVVEKSRRVGFTYVQAYEDVRDVARQIGAVDVWFSSADESAAREYIRYCEQWGRLLNLAAENLGEIAIDGEDDIKAFTIQFATGKRINALSSNPKAFRSKGGKLVLDEFAFHKQPEEMWKAALPLITWGYDARVLSTYNGKSGRYYRMVDDAKKGKNKWNLHTVTIEQAVAQGLADKIMGRTLTEADRQQWLIDLRESVGDEETWQQEYLCNPIDESTAWLTWDLIIAAEHDQAGDPSQYAGGLCYVGMDIARRRDLTVIWVVEPVGDVLWTREVVALKGASFAAQESELERVMGAYRVGRLCLDQTGIGEMLTERAKQRYGSRAEGVLFTGPVKQDLSVGLKQRFEDRLIRLPADRGIRESHHAVRKITTTAGNPRFDADRTEQGHADEYWAHALAIHAATHPAAPIDYQVAATPISGAAFSPGAFAAPRNSFAQRRPHHG